MKPWKNQGNEVGWPVDVKSEIKLSSHASSIESQILLVLTKLWENEGTHHTISHEEPVKTYVDCLSDSQRKTSRCLLTSRHPPIFHCFKRSLVVNRWCHPLFRYQTRMSSNSCWDRTKTMKSTTNTMPIKRGLGTPLQIHSTSNKQCIATIVLLTL